MRPFQRGNTPTLGVWEWTILITIADFVMSENGECPKTAFLLVINQMIIQWIIWIQGCLIVRQTHLNEDYLNYLITCWTTFFLSPCITDSPWNKRCHFLGQIDNGCWNLLTWPQPDQFDHFDFRHSPWISQWTWWISFKMVTLSIFF